MSDVKTVSQVNRRKMIPIIVLFLNHDWRWQDTFRYICKIEYGRQKVIVGYFNKIKENTTTLSDRKLTAG